MSYPPDDPQGGQYPPPPGFGPPPGYSQGGYPPPPGYGPGGPGGPGQPPFGEPIPNYMWQAIVITVLGVPCCCVSLIGLVSSGFGIAALVTSSQVGDKQRIGDIEGALAASKRIKTFLVIGAAFLAVGLVVWAILLATADWNFYSSTT